MNIACIHETVKGISDPAEWVAILNIYTSEKKY